MITVRVRLGSLTRRSAPARSTRRPRQRQPAHQHQRMALGQLGPVSSRPARAERPGQALLTKCATIAGTIESARQRDHREHDAQRAVGRSARRRRGRGRTAGRSAIAAPGGEKRVRKPRRIGPRNSVSSQTAGVSAIRNSASAKPRLPCGRRDHAAQAVRRPPWAAAAPSRRAGRPPATPTRRSGARPPAPPRTAGAGAAPSAQPAAAAARVDRGQAEQADPLEQRRPGTSARLQRQRTRAAPPGDAYSASAWPAVGALGSPASAAVRRAAAARAEHQVAQPGAQAQPASSAPSSRSES